MKVMVFDVGGTEIKYSVMDEQMNRFDAGSVPTPQDTQEHFLDTIYALYAPHKDEVDGIAMALPGFVDANTGYVSNGGALLYNTGTQVGQLVRERCGCRVTLENDGKAAAIAELRAGALQGCCNAAVFIIGTGVGGGIIANGQLVRERCGCRVTLENDGKAAAIAELRAGALQGCCNAAVFIIGTGVGGGIIANGQLVRGVHFTAGEYSFVNTNADEWENTEKTMACQCSTKYLLKWYRARKGLPADAPMNGKLFFDAANAAEPEALEVLERFCKMVAVQIYNLTVLLDVEKVAIGGGISKQPLLLDDLRRVYAGLFASRGESPYMIGLPRCEIVPCHFSSEANQVGALYTYLQAESETI